ncbi:hypothetical protein ABIA25_002887 [Sinorhizobium fredii]|uniref:hypothetical protein n=1 Tax=Rhizobium fredii TaxID=380 RepID=UPI003519298E
MAEKSADIHTLAPRLSYVEDKLDWVAENSGSGGVDQKLWRATLEGAESSGAWSSEPWVADDLIYGPESTNLLSLHQTIFGLNSNNALKCQDAKGFFGWVFPDNETRWQYGPSQSTVTLSTDIFGQTGNGYVESLRTHNQTLASMIFKDPSYIGSGDGDTIIGRIEKVGDDLEELATNFEAEFAQINSIVETKVNAAVSAINTKINDMQYFLDYQFGGVVGGVSGYDSLLEIFDSIWMRLNQLENNG